jgi:hypothetical protein
MPFLLSRPVSFKPVPPRLGTLFERGKRLLAQGLELEPPAFRFGKVQRGLLEILPFPRKT